MELWTSRVATPCGLLMQAHSLNVWGIVLDIVQQIATRRVLHHDGQELARQERLRHNISHLCACLAKEDKMQLPTSRLVCSRRIDVLCVY